MTNTVKRYAIVRGHGITGERIANYLPGNYRVVADLTTLVEPDPVARRIVLIAGEDKAGWTMDDYVIPRLWSGLWWGEEIPYTHPVLGWVDTVDSCGGCANEEHCGACPCCAESIVETP